MMKELKSSEPYEVAVGCATISFDLGDRSVMFPYASFTHGTFSGERIELLFQDWRLEIAGSELSEVWRLLQMQDIRSIRCSSGIDEKFQDAIWIRTITTTKVVAE